MATRKIIEKVIESLFAFELPYIVVALIYLGSGCSISYQEWVTDTVFYQLARIYWLLICIPILIAIWGEDN